MSRAVSLLHSQEKSLGVLVELDDVLIKQQECHARVQSCVHSLTNEKRALERKNEELMRHCSYLSEQNNKFVDVK